MNADFIFMLSSLWTMVGAIIVWMFWTTLKAAIGKRKRKVTVRVAAKRFALAMMVVILWPFGIILISLWVLKGPRTFRLREAEGK